MCTSFLFQGAGFLAMLPGTMMDEIKRLGELHDDETRNISMLRRYHIDGPYTHLVLVPVFSLSFSLSLSLSLFFVPGD